MTYAASDCGPAAASRSSTLTPVNVTSNFDHVVTQWMSPTYVDSGSSWASSQVNVVGRSTSPSTVSDQRSSSILGVASAVRTGQLRPVSYWPGGSRSARDGDRRPENPRVTGI